MSESNGNNTGRIEEIQGVVVDVLFPDKLPEIYSAVEIQVKASEGREDQNLICEVQQHLGDDRVRTVAMDATDGLRRGDLVSTPADRSPYRSATSRWAASSTSLASRSTAATRCRPTSSAGRSTVRPRKRPT